MCYGFAFASKDKNYIATFKYSWFLSELKRIFSKNKKDPEDFSKHIVSDGQMKLILKHKCTFI